MIGLQVLLESMLYTHICDNSDLMKEVNRPVYEILRKDLDTLHRNHKFYVSKFMSLTNMTFIHEFEELKEIIERYLNYETTNKKKESC